MSKYDLTPVMAPYLDRHLVLTLLEFLSAQKIYNQRDILQSKMDILSKTNMIDYVLDIRRILNPNETVVPEEFKIKRQKILTRLQELQSEVDVAMKIFGNEEVGKNIELLREPKALSNYLSKEFSFKIEVMESMYELAKFNYECGNYIVATSYLYCYLLVLPNTDKNYLNVLWGKLASSILNQNWESALDDLNKLREHIDNNSFISHLNLLQQRTWWIHWSLFVLFNHAKGFELVIEIYLYKPNYLNAIQTMCPHILRYLATAVIIRSRRNALKDLLRVIQQELYTYKDPITEFLEYLYLNYDFDMARQKLQECKELIMNDFFLLAVLDEFVENARLLIFENFCRINQCITINMLAESLNMDPDEAECWIVNLIRNARLDAKIDSKLGHVIMTTHPHSPYQQVLEKVDSLSQRSEALVLLIERKLKTRSQDIRDTF